MNQRITSPVQLRESRLAHFLFADPRASVSWLVVRLWVGYQWLNAGYHKVTDPNGGKGGRGVRRERQFESRAGSSGRVGRVDCA